MMYDTIVKYSICDIMLCITTISYMLHDYDVYEVRLCTVPAFGVPQAGGKAVELRRRQGADLLSHIVKIHVPTVSSLI